MGCTTISKLALRVFDDVTISSRILQVLNEDLEFGFKIKDIIGVRSLVIGQPNRPREPLFLDLSLNECDTPFQLLQSPIWARLRNGQNTITSVSFPLPGVNALARVHLPSVPTAKVEAGVTSDSPIDLDLEWIKQPNSTLTNILSFKTELGDPFDDRDPILYMDDRYWLTALGLLEVAGLAFFRLRSITINSDAFRSSPANIIPEELLRSPAASSHLKRLQHLDLSIWEVTPDWLKSILAIAQQLNYLRCVVRPSASISRATHLESEHFSKMDTLVSLSSTRLEHVDVLFYSAPDADGALMYSLEDALGLLPDTARSGRVLCTWPSPSRKSGAFQKGKSLKKKKRMSLLSLTIIIALPPSGEHDHLSLQHYPPYQFAKRLNQLLLPSCVVTFRGGGNIAEDWKQRNVDRWRREVLQIRLNMAEEERRLSLGWNVMESNREIKVKVEAE
jgi:hypothetical protein